MPQTVYTFEEFSQWQQSGIGMLFTGNDLKQLNGFITNRDGVAAKQIGAFGLDQLTEIYPAIVAAVQGSKAFPGDSIDVYGDDDKVFVVFAQPSGNRAVVWRGWRTESTRNQFEVGPGAVCLRELALRAMGAHKDSCKLNYPEQGETAFMWKASAVHPLQGLETTYQRIVHAAGRSPGSDPRQAESDALARFFQQGTVNLS
jgi:hypothetical protein